MSVNKFIDLPRLPLVNPDGSINADVTGTIVTDPNVNIHDSAGNSLTSTAGSLDVNVTNSPLVTSIVGDVTVLQGTTPWTIDGSVSVTNFPAVQPISGTVTALQGTSPWVVSGTVTTSPNVNIHDSAGNSLTSTASALDVNIKNTTLAVTQSTSPWIISGAVTQSGTWTTGRTWALSLASDHVNAAQEGAWSVAVNNFPATQPVSGTVTALQGTSPWVVSGTVTSTQGTSPWVVSGTVAATQSGTWTTGRTWTLSNATDSVASVQSGAWSVAVNNFPATQPVSGTVTALQGTSPWVVSGSVTATQGTSPWVVSGTVAATQSGTWNINNISGTISLPTGAATEATLAKLPLTQASTTSGQSGVLMQGAVTTAAPTYTTGQTDPLSLTTAGALRVDGSATTQPVSGTVTANQGGAPWSFNQTQVNGVAVSTGNGVAGTGVQRVTIASDNTAFTVNAAQSGTWTTGRTWTLASGTDSVTNNMSQVGGSAITLGQKTMANSLPVTLASDQSALLVTTVPGNPTVATYSASANFTVAALLATDIFTILGSGTKTIQVRRITVSGINTANTNALINIIKRSTADSGGTSTVLTNVPQDSNNAAATATVRSYTVNPTLGTAVGTVDSQYIFFPALASSNVSNVREFDYGVFRDQAIYLRGTSEQLVVNAGGVTLGGTTLVSIKVEWTEE